MTTNSRTIRPTINSFATDFGRPAIGYRKDLVSEPITSYEDVFKLMLR